MPVIGLISPEVPWGDAHSSFIGGGANKAFETQRLYLELRKDPKYLGKLIDEILETCWLQQSKITSFCSHSVSILKHRNIY